MKKEQSLFRVLTFILVPFGALMGLVGLFALAMALANISALFSAFIMIAFTIYVFTSLTFLTKGIDMGRPMKHSLRDWIRVNAYVSGFMAIMSLVNVASIMIMSDASLQEFSEKFMQSQSNLPPMLNKSFFVSAIKAAAWFMGILSIILLIHIYLNFRLMKMYRNLFQ